MTIIVTGTIDYDPANFDTALAAVTACMAATRAEAGNERYVFSQDLEDKGRIHVVEQWSSQEAIDEHMASAHLAELMGQMGALGVTGVSLIRWDGATPTTMM